MKKYLLTMAVCCGWATLLTAQDSSYTTANAHSHNDYANPVPFTAAYDEQFGSIEADIMLWHDTLFVGHGPQDIPLRRTLEHLYLDRIDEKLQANHGYPYADSARHLQMLIDIKTGADSTMARLMKVLNKYPRILSARNLQFVISGNRPDPGTYAGYPAYVAFDGEFGKNYPAAALAKIPMFSDNLKTYTGWNGKGILSDDARKTVDSLVHIAHSLHKTIRFWNAPDFPNAWYQLIHAGADYLNTDLIAEIGAFLGQLKKNSYQSPTSYKTYQPAYRSDGVHKKVKNIILLIGDGCGWPQLYAGYTANHGALNIFNIRNVGVSKTSSHDNYVTDSAPGSTSMASGVKTNNRYVGVDHTGAPLTLIPVMLGKKKIISGLVTSGDVTDATPADFYAHQKERDSSVAIIRELKASPISILAGSGNESLSNVKLLNEDGRQHLNESIVRELEPEFTIVGKPDSMRNAPGKRWLVIDKQAGLPAARGRGDWLNKAFNKTVSILSANPQGFFLMTEGAQVDYGGHDNNLPYVVTEVFDFDKVVESALRFADKNGETLVIVTADHETGGLTLLDGDYTKGYVSGNFSSNDHSALPVPVFAYGPNSDLFRGVYENTAIFDKMLQAMGIGK